MERGTQNLFGKTSFFPAWDLRYFTAAPQLSALCLRWLQQLLCQDPSRPCHCQHGSSPLGQCRFFYHLLATCKIHYGWASIMGHGFSSTRSPSWSPVVPVRGPSISMSFAPLEGYIDTWARRLFPGLCEINQDLFRDWELGAHHGMAPTHIALMHTCFCANKTRRTGIPSFKWSTCGWTLASTALTTAENKGLKIMKCLPFGNFLSN